MKELALKIRIFLVVGPTMTAYLPLGSSLNPNKKSDFYHLYVNRDIWVMTGFDKPNCGSFVQRIIP